MAKSLSAPFIECSASDGVNIDVAFRELVKLIRKDERVCIPLSYRSHRADRIAKIVRSETKRYGTTIHNILCIPHATTLQFTIKANGRKSQYRLSKRFRPNASSTTITNATTATAIANADAGEKEGGRVRVCFDVIWIQ
jgi:hypothetical protein